VRDVSKVLEDLGMHPILEIPQDSCIAGEAMEALDVILECLKDAYDSSHGP
jgi:hypothetical protein